MGRQEKREDKLVKREEKKRVRAVKSLVRPHDESEKAAAGAAGPPESDASSETDAAALAVLEQVLGKIADVRLADSIEAETRASAIWAIRRAPGGEERFGLLIKLLDRRLARDSVAARDYVRMLGTVADDADRAVLMHMLRNTTIGAVPPAWATRAGRATVEAAHIYHAGGGDVFTVCLECRHSGATDAHHVCAVIDRSNWAVVDASVHRTPASIPDYDKTSRQISLEEARDILDRGIAAAEAGLTSGANEGLLNNWQLLRHYVDRLPHPDAPRGCTTAEHAGIRACVDEFLASPEGRGLQDCFAGEQARREALCGVVVGGLLATTGDPLAVTPESLAAVSAQIPVDVAQDPVQTQQFYELLRAYATYAHRQMGWASHNLDRTLGAIRVDGAGQLVLRPPLSEAG